MYADRQDGRCVTAQSSCTAQGQAPSAILRSPPRLGLVTSRPSTLTISSHLLDMRQRHGSICPGRPVQQSGVCHHNCLRLFLLLLGQTVSPLCPLTPRLLKATPCHPGSLSLSTLYPARKGLAGGCWFHHHCLPPSASPALRQLRMAEEEGGARVGSGAGRREGVRVWGGRGPP